MPRYSSQSCEERQADPDHPRRTPLLLFATSLSLFPSVCAQLRPHHVKPSTRALPGKRRPHRRPTLFDNIDLVLASSGSSGEPRLVGLSIDALMASVEAHSCLGPGRWILALSSPHRRALKYSCALPRPKFRPRSSIVPMVSIRSASAIAGQPRSFSAGLPH